MPKGRPSTTAYKVAACIVTLGTMPEMADVLPPGIADASARLLIESGAVSPGLVRWSRHHWMVSVYKAFDWMMPGQFEAFAHRKAFCERQVRESIAAGAFQVLVLGAGYDTMGWRLAPEFPHVDLFEIDHPATAALKAARGVARLSLTVCPGQGAQDAGRESLRRRAVRREAGIRWPSRYRRGRAVPPP